MIRLYSLSKIPVLYILKNKILKSHVLIQILKPNKPNKPNTPNLKKSKNGRRGEDIIDIICKILMEKPPITKSEDKQMPSVMR